MANGLINFKQRTLEEWKAEKKSNTIYFLTDQDAICIGEKVYRSGVAGITYRSENQSSISCAAGSWTTIPIYGKDLGSTEDFGKLFWSGSSDGNGIAIEEDGLYYIEGSAYLTISSFTGQVTRMVGIFIDSTEMVVNGDNAYFSNGSSSTTLHTGGKLLSLTAGNVIYLKARIVGTSGTAIPTSPHTYLSIMKIQ